ncbi:MAG: RIP metalloprotease RseP [Clostridiales bacterium]|nr:RIP metalloprotease RseP [Clostridiales bacterium]
MLTAIYAILIFCLLIFVHEFGHFIAAKAVGIRVNEFSLGMGPRLLHKQGKETEYSLRLLPIGGFCKMEGEDEESEDPRAFNHKPIPARILVVVSGALMNFITCIVIITLMYLTSGFTTTTIGAVVDGYPAAEAGVRAGDTILEIDGAPIESWNDILNRINEAEGDTLSLAVERDGKTLRLSSPLVTGEGGRKMIGIEVQKEYDFFRSVKYGFTGTWEWAKSMYGYFGQLFTGQGSMDDLMGPVGIVATINDQAKLGFIYIVNLTAMISLNLGIVNLLPLPALDGGRLVFLLISLITGKKISEETEGKVHFVGLLLLFGLMIFLVFQDMGRLF